MPLSKLFVSLTATLFILLISVNACGAQTDLPDFSKQKCYECHGEVRQFFEESVHKDYSCNVCHLNIDSDHLIAAEGEVEVVRPEVTPVSPQNVPDTCGACHNQELTAYMDSVHGRALMLGTIKTANCIDCHSSHNVMQVADKNSTVSEANLPDTCGKCHVAPQENYAKGIEHQTYLAAGTAQHYTFKFFIWLTILTVAALIIHMEVELLHLFRKARRPK